MNSDIDFLVDFDPQPTTPDLLSRYLSLAEGLENILGKDVDIITPGAIRNPYFRKAVEASRQPVYAA